MTRLPLIEEYICTLHNCVKALDIRIIHEDPPKRDNWVALACYRAIGHKYTIKVSSLFFDMIEEQQMETLVHELCHIIAHSLDGTMTHNETWRNQMKQFGYVPSQFVVPLCN